MFSVLGNEVLCFSAFSDSFEMDSVHKLRYLELDSLLRTHIQIHSGRAGGSENSLNQHMFSCFLPPLPKSTVIGPVSQ